MAIINESAPLGASINSEITDEDKFVIRNYQATSFIEAVWMKELLEKINSYEENLK